MVSFAPCRDPGRRGFLYRCSNRDVAVVEAAILVLSSISQQPDGAKAIVDTGALVFVTELLKSRSTVVQEQTCRMVANLAHHESTAVAVIYVGACVELRMLLLFQ